MFYWWHAYALRTYGALASAIAACASLCANTPSRNISWILDNSDDNFSDSNAKIVVFFGFR